MWLRYSLLWRKIRQLKNLEQQYLITSTILQISSLPLNTSSPWRCLSSNIYYKSCIFQCQNTTLLNRPPAPPADRTINIDPSIVKKKYNFTYKNLYLIYNSKKWKKIKLSEVNHVLVCVILWTLVFGHRSNSNQVRICVLGISANRVWLVDRLAAGGRPTGLLK